jgi:Fe2+ transport system protein FeoA
MDLVSLKAGEKAKFLAVHGRWGMIRRLSTMGIYPGVVITKISGQFMHGPVIIQAGNTLLAIGYHMARRMLVERIHKN